MQRLLAPELPDWLAPMVPFQRYSVEILGHRIHVMETGSGIPVLMLHGNPTWGFLYRRVALALSGTPLRIIMPDLLGLGFSDKPTDPSEHTLEGHARIIRRLVDQILEDSGDKRLIFVGQDWGGPIGLRALAEKPEQVAGLVLLNTVVGPPRPGFRPTAFHRFARLPLVADFVFHRLGFPQNILATAQGDRKSISGLVSRAYRYPLREVRDRVAPLALARMVPDSPTHPSIEPLRRCQEFIENYQGPCSIVWGDRDPVLGRVRGWIEKLLPRAEVTRTTAGHFLQEEVPLEIAAAVRKVSRLAAG